MPLESQSFFVMLYIFSCHILENPIQKYVLCSLPPLLFSRFASFFIFKASAFFQISFRVGYIFGVLYYLQHSCFIIPMVVQYSSVWCLACISRIVSASWKSPISWKISISWISTWISTRFYTRPPISWQISISGKIHILENILRKHDKNWQKRTNILLSI